MIPVVKNSIVKTDPTGKKLNTLRGKEMIPEEMLPKTNRVCGYWGHDWEIIGNRKKCRRYLCEVSRAYKPNEFKWNDRLEGNYSIHAVL